MSSQSEVIHCYEQLLPLAARMLILAKEKEWGALPELETRCSALIERLKVIEPLEKLDEQQRLYTYRLLGRLLADREAIMGIIGPQVAQLGATLESMQRSQGLNQAYRQ
ncbi:flagellar protein FliT [Polaromonas sp. UC242_47]|uniref:flagellar protein FliT n=1 Tax=Polaromonas sp. UC242_47 TaxID=3374626 RepID=UPI00379DC15F